MAFSGECVDMMLESDPSQKQYEEGEIEKTLVRDGQNDEDGRERQKDDDETMYVVIVALETMQKRNEQR